MWKEFSIIKMLLDVRIILEENTTTINGVLSYTFELILSY